jgi:DNA-binding NtrC family response regulator
MRWDSDMATTRLATIVPLPAPDADYRLLVPVLREISRGVDLQSTFRAVALGLRRLTRFDWLAIARRSRDGRTITVHASLSGRPEWLAVTDDLQGLSPEAEAWLAPDVSRMVGPSTRPAGGHDPQWPVPRDIGPLLAVPLPAPGESPRTSRGALLLGRVEGAFEPHLVALLEPCAAHIGVLLERTEWLEQFRTVNAQLQARIRELESKRRSEAPTISDLPVVRREADIETGRFECEEWRTSDPIGIAVLELVHRAAETDLPVLLTGESGTGKELLARTIHLRSDRRNGPWVAVNVAALASELTPSEFFGHAAGSFTGARGHRKGLLEEANGGTLFLDEVGELPRTLQPLLLRFLEDGLVRPVGANHARQVDVRIVAATNRDLVADIANGRFRDDLFHRIAAVEVRLPTLRERPADLADLLRGFLREASGGRWSDVPAAWWPALRAHAWPGNVRELRNAMRAVALMSRGPRLEARFLPPGLRAAVAGGSTSTDAPLPTHDPYDGWTLNEVERESIRRALIATEGHRGRAAARLGITPRSLYDRVRRFELT